MVLLMLLPPSLLLLASCWYTKVKENHARCCRKARHDRNKHRFLLPVTTDGHSWHLTPAHHVNLTRDHSSASENGVKEFFTDYEVFSADCTFHASPAYWSRKQPHGAIQPKQCWIWTLTSNTKRTALSHAALTRVRVSFHILKFRLFRGLSHFARRVNKCPCFCICTHHMLSMRNMIANNNMH